MCYMLEVLQKQIFNTIVQRQVLEQTSLQIEAYIEAIFSSSYDHVMHKGYTNSHRLLQGLYPNCIE